jgi:hypothetical protein
VIGRSHWPACWPANVADRIEDSNPTIFLSRYEDENIRHILLVAENRQPMGFAIVSSFGG